MMGMDERTGKLISGRRFVQQGVERAIRIRKGSRPMARWYGTNHMRQLGEPITSISVLELTSDLADSIESTIPDVNVRTISDQENGNILRVSLQLEGSGFDVEV